MKKRKVLFIPYTYSMGGGAERVLREILQHLDYSKYDVDVMECAHYGNGNEPYFKEVQWLRPIWDFTKNNSLISILYQLQYWIATLFPSIFKYRLPHKKYDVAIAFNYQIPSFLIIHCNANRKVAWVHSQVDDIDYKQFMGGGKLKKYLKYHSQKKAFLNTDEIITISSLSKESIERLFPCSTKKISIIRNGSDLDSIIYKSHNNALPKKHKYRLVSCGRLSPEKNISFLISVLALLIKDNIDVELVIAGEGRERQMLENQVKEMNLSKHVVFTGFLKNPYGLLKTGDLLCISSISEGSPVIIAEALTLGIPFISTNVGGIKEFSNGGKAGIICKLDTIEYKNTVEALLINDQQRRLMSENGKEVIKQFDINNTIKEVERLLNKD